MNGSLYLSTLLGSLTSLASYPELLKRPLRWSLVFFFLSYLGLGLLSASRFALRDLPQLETAGRQALDELSSRFPSELEIVWDQKTLTHSGSDILSLPYPSTLTPSQWDLPPVLGYHLNRSVAAEELNPILPERSLVVLSDTQIFVNGLQGNWDQLPLTELPGFDQAFVINKSSLPSFIAKMDQALSSGIKTLQLATLILMPLLLGVLRLWSLGIDTLLTYLLIRLNGLPLSWGKLFQLNLHILVVAEVVNQMAGWLYPHQSWPLLSLSFWVILILVILTQRSSLLNFIKLNR
jgi:hypothetical protein